MHYMRAEIAIDPEGVTPVYYYFERTSGPSANSGWQTDQPGVPGNQWLVPVPAQFSPYSYTVKYGDATNGGSVSVPCPVTSVTWHP